MEKNLTLSSLILLHSAIDTIGLLDSTEIEATRSTYLAWVEKYYLPATSLQCSGLDLYAARCGLLHATSPDSKISRQGAARRFCYVHGKGTASEFANLLDDSAAVIVVHVRDLYEGLCHAIDTYLAELETDPERKARVDQRATVILYACIPRKTLLPLLEAESAPA